MDIILQDKKGLIGLSEVDKIILLETNPEDFINFTKIDMKIREEMIEILPLLIEKWFCSDLEMEIQILMDDLLEINEPELVRLLLNYTYKPEEDFELYSRSIRYSFNCRNEHILKYILILVPDGFDWENGEDFIKIRQPDMKEYCEFLLNAAIASKSSPMIEITTDLYDKHKKDLAEKVMGDDNSDVRKEMRRVYYLFISLEPLINKAKFTLIIDRLKKSWICINKDENYDQNVISRMENVIHELDELF